MKFSQRIGQTEVKTILQKDSIDDELKVKLWNAFHDDFFSFYQREDSGFLVECFKDIWSNYFGKRVNTYSISTDYNLKNIETWFFSVAKWYDIFDFIEIIAFYVSRWEKKYQQENLIQFIKNSNFVLERELSAYRIINFKVTPISDEVEITSIENASKNDSRFKEVSTHINTSISYLSNRENPDYRNSIKESISAVETICKIITGEKTLGKALNNLEKSGIKIHPSMKSAFDKLYFYTNDSKTGIRHALVDAEYSPDFDEAKFMLVTCSSFINYLKSKSN